MTDADLLASLTQRESEVLELIARGRTNAGISAELFIGVSRVEKTVTAIFEKLQLTESQRDHRRVLAAIVWISHHLQINEDDRESVLTGRRRLAGV
jgi:DNA-binding NarL/FixJ family response regulator